MRRRADALKTEEERQEGNVCLALLPGRFLSTSGDISAAPCGATRDLVLIRGG